jgi:hypothetical protein
MKGKGAKVKKQRIEPEPDDEFMKMDYQQLQTQISNSKEKYLDLKTRRNYYQMDRDMVEQFYFNIKQEIDEVKTAIHNKETTMQQYILLKVGWRRIIR